MEAAIPSEDIVLVKKFTTTGDGNVGGTTLVCSQLTSYPNYNELVVKLQSGDYKGQAKPINGDTTTGTITVTEAFGGQVVSGTQFAIIGIPAGAEADVATVLARLGVNTDPAGTNTVFAWLRHIVEDYLAHVDFGLSALRTLILNVYSFLTGNDAGSGTLNDANTSDTLTPTKRPCSMHLIFDISNLNHALDDFDIEVKVGTVGNEREVAYYNLTSNGTDITADTGSGTGIVIKIRRIDIQHILVAASEQVLVELTRNGPTDRGVPYKFANGGGI